MTMAHGVPGGEDIVYQNESPFTKPELEETEPGTPTPSLSQLLRIWGYLTGQPSKGRSC